MTAIICYNAIERWKSKKRALKFYKEGALSCDGCESERYSNIVFDLLEGKQICTDGYTDIYKLKHHKFPNGTDIRDLNGIVEYPL